MTKAMNLALATLAIVLMAATSWGAVPPPPANQNLGIPDSVFNALEEADCRVCHNQNPPIDAVDPAYLPDRHHDYTDAPINLATSQAPNGDPNGDGLYECLSCHSMVFNGLAWVLDTNFRDCLGCHQVTAGSPLSVHHATPNAQAGNCVACHGFIENPLEPTVDDWNLVAADGSNKYVPGYQPSNITPWPSQKDNGDPLPNTNPSPSEPGNCNFCHNVTPNADGTLPDFVIDPDSGVMVFSNQDTHHGTGLGSDTTKCIWCHNTNQPAPFNSKAYAIRTCQNCHSVATLHNIQAISDPADTYATITPGQENPWFGHIGAQEDCWGCHGFDNPGPQALGASPTGALLPDLDYLSKSRLIKGMDTVIKLYGDAFSNVVPAPMPGLPEMLMECKVVVTDAIGVKTILTPSSLTESEMVVTVPGTLEAGNYDIVAAKGDVEGDNYVASRALNLTVAPVAEIYGDADCNNGTVTITGSGFGGFMPAADAGTSVSRGGKACKVLSWTANEIVAECGTEGTTVDISTIYGSASADVVGCDSVVTADAPEVTRLSRTSGRAGYRVTIYGKYFGRLSDTSYVNFGGTEAQVRSWSENRVSFKVPRLSKGTYPVSVVVDGMESAALSYRIR